MSYELLWVEGIDEDLKKTDEKFFFRLVSKLQFICNSNDPFRITDSIKGMPTDIRKIRLGEMRIFLHIKNILKNIYCLLIKHRKEAYKRKTLNEILTIRKKLNK